MNFRNGNQYCDRHHHLLLLAALLLIVVPASAETARIYVTNSAGDTIDVIDPTTNKIVQVIKGIECPHGINFSPDGSRVYISNEAESVLDVVNRKTGEIINKVRLSGHPNNIAVTKDGGRVVVAIAQAPGAVDVIDTNSLTLIKSISVEGAQHNLYVTPDGKYVVTGSVQARTLTAIDLATLEPAWVLKFDKGVRPMTFDSNTDGSTHRIYLQLSGFNGFAIVDFATHKEVARIKFPEDPTGFGVTEGRADSPSHGIGVAPDGKTIWANSSFANAVFFYSLPEVKLLGHVKLPELNLAGRPPIGAIPDWMAFTPDGKTIYIADSAQNAVSAIDTRTLRVVAKIPVGMVPKRMNTLVLP